MAFYYSSFVSNIKLSQTSRQETYAPHFALFFVQILFGTWPIVGKFVLRTLPSTGLASLRVIGAALMLLALRQFRVSVKIEDKRDYAKLLLFSLLGIVFNQLLFLKGLSLTTVVNASILSASIPVFALLVGVIIGSDHLTVAKVIGIILAAMGVVYLVDPLRADFSSGYAFGNLLLVLNTFCYGCYIAISKNVISRYGTLTSVFWIFLFAAVIMLPIGFFSLDSKMLIDLTTPIWFALIYIIIFPTVCAYFLNAWALTRVDPSVVAVYIYLQPLIAVLLAYYFLGEKWNSRALVSTLLIFSGLFFVTRRKRKIEIHTTMP